MKVLTTSKGYTYHPNWLFEENGRISLKLMDKRRISDIAFEFEDCRLLHYEAEYYEPQDFEGYTDLTQVKKTDDNCWLIILEQPKGVNDV